MKMTRTFQPVGQGAYFTEQFVKDDGSTVNVVYDCGSDSLRHKDLESVIHSSFAKGSVIDALFISHFDGDHVNGVPILLQWCRVKKIVLPKIASRAEIAYWRFKSHAAIDKEGGFHIPVADRLLGLQDGNVERMFKDFGVRNIPVVDHVKEVSVERAEEAVREPLKIGAKVYYDFGLPDWVFVPYNFRRFDREADFRDVFKSALVMLLPSIDLDEFIGNTAEVFNRIGEDASKRLLRTINRIIRNRLRNKNFRKNFGTINGNSMTLYSGEREENDHYILLVECKCENTRYKAGCLYFGDYEAKDDCAYREMKRFYVAQKCWDGIGCIQLPHHGSKHNYNLDLDQDGRCYVASFGLGNRNHHPGKDVVINLMKNGRTVIFSTEANHYQCHSDIIQLIS